MKLKNKVQVLSTEGIHTAALRAKARAAAESGEESDAREFVGFVREITGLHPRTGAVLTQREIEARGLSTPQRWGDVQNVRDLRDALDSIELRFQEPIAGDRVRNVQTSAFALVTSAISVREVSAAYEAVPSVMPELVTEMDDVQKVTFLVNVLHEDNNVKEVPEGKPFPMLGAGEEKFTVGHKRNGRMIAITQELIEENNKGEIISRLAGLGTIAMELIEEDGLELVTDHFGSGSSAAAPYLLTMDGPKSFFQGNNNVLPRLAASGNRLLNTPLNDETSLEAARLLLAGQKNSRNKRIALPNSQLVLFVPDALKAIAFKILNSEYVPGTVNEINPWGPRGQNRPKLVTTPKLDDLSTSAWYYGAPKRVLKRKWKLRPEIVMHGGASGTSLPFVNAREGFRVRVAWDQAVGAMDYLHWVQALAGSTAPVDA